jgi:hypothetical protein
MTGIVVGTDAPPDEIESDEGPALGDGSAASDDEAAADHAIEAEGVVPGLQVATRAATIGRTPRDLHPRCKARPPGTPAGRRSWHRGRRRKGYSPSDDVSGTPVAARM